MAQGIGVRQNLLLQLRNKRYFLLFNYLGYFFEHFVDLGDLLFLTHYFLKIQSLGLIFFQLIFLNEALDFLLLVKLSYDAGVSLIKLKV
jgi:hypothetical protein